MSKVYTPPYGHRHIELGGDKDITLRSFLDRAVLKDYERFVNKVNERTLYQRGLKSEYDSSGDPALGLEVEYFHPSITADDRMVYIMENIVSIPSLDWRDVIGNTIISHFYGARGVHSVLTGEEDPKKAHVDFVMLARDQINFSKTGVVGKYTSDMRLRAVNAKKNKEKIWGTTELHTSIQTAGRRFVNALYKGDSRHEDKGTWLNVCEWVASWAYNPSSFNSERTVMEGLRTAESLEEAFSYLTGEKLIGEYYGYHCSTSNSVNPALNFVHDDTFVAPGPGARETLDVMFPRLPTKKVSYGDRVVWVRENQHELLNIKFHPSLWNYCNSYGVKIFEDNQDELKNYGTEVSLCQYSVYLRLKENPELISRRKIARSNAKLSENKVCKPKNLRENKSKKEKEEMESERSFVNLITNIFRKKNSPELVPGNSVVKNKKSKQSTTPDVSEVSESALDFSVTQKEDIILSAFKKIGNPCTHNDILLEIKSRGLESHFKLSSNWKETWTIMQGLVKKNVLEKNGKNYSRV